MLKEQPHTASESLEGNTLKDIASLDPRRTAVILSDHLSQYCASSEALSMSISSYTDMYNLSTMECNGSHPDLPSGPSPSPFPQPTMNIEVKKMGGGEGCIIIILCDSEREEECHSTRVAHVKDESPHGGSY